MHLSIPYRPISRSSAAHVSSTNAASIVEQSYTQNYVNLSMLTLVSYSICTVPFLSHVHASLTMRNAVTTIDKEVGSVAILQYTDVYWATQVQYFWVNVCQHYHAALY